MFFIISLFIIQFEKRSNKIKEKFNLNLIFSKRATKSNLIQLLEEKFNVSPIEYDFNRIESLISSLKPEIQFLVEYPYTDSHYRSSFYMYYSAKYKKYDRDTVRVHLFSKNLEKENVENFDKSYMGFFIVRPLQRHPLGRTFINPKAFLSDDFVACQCKIDVHFFDLTFSLCAFPHVAQDTETHSCAESSVWSLLSYFGLKYPEYKTFLPEEIIKRLTTSSKDRLLPSGGLTADEIAICLNASGQNCILESVPDEMPSCRQDEDFAIMRIYVESGMPFVVTLTNKKNIGHAVIAIGHENVKNADVVSFFSKNKNDWDDISFYDKKIVFIDDNFPPYQMDNCSKPVTRYIQKYPDSGWDDVHIKSYIVPLQKHMYLDARRAYNLVKRIFKDPNYSLSKFGKKWLTRLLLTKSSSLKKSLVASEMPDLYKKLINRLNLPKFVWLCEIYKIDDYTDEKASGILLLDSHGDDTVGSIIFYVVKDSFIKNNGKYLINPLQLPVVFFKKGMYRNNLE